MNPRTTILTLALALTSSVFVPAAVEARDYRVDVYTGDKYGAGTDSNIFLTIHGERGQTKECRLNGHIRGNAFESGNIDSLVLRNLKDVGNLTHVVVRSDGTYAGSDWYLEKVEIDYRPFDFRRWIDVDNGRVRSR
jgi:hypothetical protein